MNELCGPSCTSAIIHPSKEHSYLFDENNRKNQSGCSVNSQDSGLSVADNKQREVFSRANSPGKDSMKGKSDSQRTLILDIVV
mmetsp:Transcript_14816/g.30225  ORF Transcript_14816/g.30225 Transcript_14816/m.30225 type:complete len:83 (+) Transcript_14816:19-267(+)|eukprot:scaffold1992_cov187-Amphora_coffeaeformis.AAC.30